MATHTTHYNLIKPTSAERVAVGDINDNSDIIDGNLFQANERADQMADDYNASETYNTGDYVRRENYLYKCNTDNTTGTWDDTKWDRVKVMDEISQGGGGGSSTLAGLDDVNISTPTTGQALIYDSTTHKWVNGAGGGGSSTLAGLSDVSVSGVANKDIIRYNSTSQKYEKSSALTDLELAVSQISASTLGITNGHDILDSNGTAMAQEDGLQFASGYVEDDAIGGKTIYIEMIRISQANYDTLKANGQLKPGAKYFIYDAQPVAVNASNLPYSSTQSTKQAIDDALKVELFDVTYDQDIESVVHKSHYINSKVVHIFELIKIKNSFSGNHTLFTFSKTAAAQGMSIVLFQATSQWGVYSNIRYGYLGPTSIVTNESFTANQYVLIDTITAVS